MSRCPILWVNAAAMMGVAMATKDEEFAVMLVVQNVAYLRPSELCNLTAGQVIRPLQGSGASSWAFLLAPQEDLKASETAEFDESVLLDGHLSVALGQALMRYTTGKASATPLFSRTQTGYALDFARSEKSVRRYEKHARLLKETTKLSVATRKYGQLVISRMARLLSGAQPLPPPVLTRLVRNRA